MTDELDRLVKAFTTSKPVSYAHSCYEYTYDAAGNRKSTTVNLTEEALCSGSPVQYDYNSGNELECRMKTKATCSNSSASEVSGYSYDGAGNETAITGFSDPASTGFLYNNLNQLQSLTPPSSGAQSLSYIGRGQSQLASLGAVTLQNSALGLTKQVNEAGTSHYARTPKGLLVDERLPGGTTYNPIYDAQGDVIGLLNSSGELVQSIRYGPYGENANATGSVPYRATSDPFLFQGGYHVPGGNTGAGNVPTGLYHFGERFYDPTTGRWTQPDNNGEAYLFDRDDPVNEVDPNGTCPFDRDVKPAIFSRGSYTYIEIWHQG